jgi:hypothetical protein
MAKKYLIRPGFSFRDGDKVLSGGEVIILDLDMAILHRDKIDEQLEEPVQAVAPAPVVETQSPMPADAPDLATVQTSAQAEEGA